MKEHQRTYDFIRKPPFQEAVGGKIVLIKLTHFILTKFFNLLLLPST